MPQLSSAVAKPVLLGFVAFGVAQSTVISTGHTILGGKGSTTVTEMEQEDMFPATSLAVTTTVTGETATCEQFKLLGATESVGVVQLSVTEVTNAVGTRG
jgi:hypothetical protein